MPNDCNVNVIVGENRIIFILKVEIPLWVIIYYKITEKEFCNNIYYDEIEITCGWVTL